VGEHAGVEGGRVVAPEPRRLVDGDRERGGVGLAEAEAAERGDHLPDPLHRHRVEAAGQGLGAEPRGGAVRAALLRQVTADQVRLGQAAAGHHVDDPQDLLVEDHHSPGLL
jgi:hypothetical protein